MKSSSPFIAVALATLSFCSLLLAQQDEMPANSIQRKLRSMRGSERSTMISTPAPKAPAVPGWMAATACPTVIARYAFAQVGEDLYVISGATPAGPVTAVNRYNATTNAWTPRTPIPVGSEAPAATYSSFNNKIYVADGFGGSCCVSTTLQPTAGPLPAPDLALLTAMAQRPAHIRIIFSSSVAALTQLPRFPFITSRVIVGLPVPMHRLRIKLAVTCRSADILPDRRLWNRHDQ